MSELLETIILNNDYEQLLNFPALEKQEINIKSPKYIGKNQSSTHLPLISIPPLHVAAMADSLECYRVIEYMTQKDFSYLNSSNYTPLHYACLYGSYEIISYIFGQIQRDPNLQSKWQKVAQDDVSKMDDRNLVYYAALAGSYEIISILIKNHWGGDRVDQYVSRAIITSIHRNSPECLKILLKYKRGSLPNTNDLTPLMSAISSQTENAVPILLQTKCNLHYMTNQGYTALSIACMVGMVSAVRMICDRMQSIDIPSSAYGEYESAVHWMCSSGNPEIVSIMLEKYPDLNYTVHGKTGIMCIPKSQPSSSIIKILELLINNGYILNNNGSELNYFLSAISPKMDVIEWFINHGANLDSPPPKSTNNMQQTIRGYIIEKAKRDNQFKQLVQKYPDLFQQKPPSDKTAPLSNKP